MRHIFVILTIILLSRLTFAQNCGCADNFAWLKETFEQNDAGFQYVLDQKGESDYQKHTELYAEKVKSISDYDQCAATLSEWLRYFRRGHLSLQALKAQKTPELFDMDNIRTQYADWEKYAYDEKEFNAYISQLTTPGLEGIWSSPPYKVGIRKVKNEYIGFILEADGVYWSPSQVKFRIKEENGKLSATFYMKDHSARAINNVHLMGSNYLSMDFVLYKRLSPVFPADISIERYLKYQSTDVPILEQLSDETIIIRRPSFDGSAKEQIDSLIAANMPRITQTENLIIDLQNNGGGSDGSFEKLIPLIYTHPIRVVGVEFLSTPLNNQRMEDFANDPEISADDRRWARDAANRLNRNLGQFVNLDTTIVSFEAYDTIYAFPKNVGIIINGGCGSTTEQFILAAKQSKKVKLFGTTTFGSLDISNMYWVKSPCNDYELGYCLSRSYRIPEFTIDGKGLQPDFYIDNTIPDYEWIDFVNGVLSNP